MTFVKRARFAAMSLVNWPLATMLGFGSQRFVERTPATYSFLGINGDFRDNVAYTYLNAADALGDCVWLASSRAQRDQLEAIGVRTLLRRSPAGIRRLLQSSTVIVCDNSSWVTWFGHGATVFNLWHGIPTKRIGYDMTGALGYKFPDPSRSDPVARAIRRGRPAPTKVVSLSPTLTPRFMSAFSVDRDACVEIGYPRCDHLVSSDSDSEAARSLRSFHGVTVAEGDAVRIGYFPTWRDTGSTQRAQEALDRLLAANPGFAFDVYYKRHHLMDDLEASAASSGDSAGPTLHRLPPDCDLNSVLGHIDVLVSDYSSVCWDFVLLDRPAIFLEVDRERYSEERGFYSEVSALIYGDVIEDLDDLDAALIDAVKNPERNADLRRVARQTLWGDFVGQASDDVVAALSSASR